MKAVPAGVHSMLLGNYPREILLIKSPITSDDLSNILDQKYNMF